MNCLVECKRIHLVSASSGPSLIRAACLKNFSIITQKLVNDVLRTGTGIDRSS